MSHCTKFEFNYSDERTIVKAFKKMNVNPDTSAVFRFSSDLTKILLGSLGAGEKTNRAITGIYEDYNIFLIKEDENRYSFYLETSDKQRSQNDELQNQIADLFKKSYISVVVDDTVRKIENSNTPAKVEEVENGYIIRFGSLYEYTLSILMNYNRIIEEVEGVKGEFCTKLTEDIENILGHPEGELETEWKPEYDIVNEDYNIQVLSLTF